MASFPKFVKQPGVLRNKLRPCCVRRWKNWGLSLRAALVLWMMRQSCSTSIGILAALTLQYHLRGPVSIIQTTTHSHQWMYSSTTLNHFSTCLLVLVSLLCVFSYLSKDLSYCMYLCSPCFQTFIGIYFVKQLNKVSAISMFCVSPSPCKYNSSMSTCYDNSSVSLRDSNSSMLPCKYYSSLFPCNDNSSMSPCDGNSSMSPCDSKSSMSPCDDISSLSPCDGNSSMSPCNDNNSCHHVIIPLILVVLLNLLIVKVQPGVLPLICVWQPSTMA